MFPRITHVHPMCCSGRVCVHVCACRASICSSLAEEEKKRGERGTFKANCHLESWREGEDEGGHSSSCCIGNSKDRRNELSCSWCTLLSFLYAMRRKVKGKSLEIQTDPQKLNSGLQKHSMCDRYIAHALICFLCTLV